MRTWKHSALTLLVVTTLLVGCAHQHPQQVPEEYSIQTLESSDIRSGEPAVPKSSSANASHIEPGTTSIRQPPTCNTEQYYTDFHLAASRGDYARIDQMIVDGVDVDSLEGICRRDSDGRLHCGLTPLHLAVQSGNVDVVRILLAAGFDADAKIDEQYRDDEWYHVFMCRTHVIRGTPIISAADSKYILRSGPAYLGDDRLYMPIEQRRELQLMLIESLLNYGADPSPESVIEVFQPLPSVLQPGLPSEARNVAAAALLLDFGANPEWTCKAARISNDTQVMDLIDAACRDSNDCNCGP